MAKKNKEEKRLEKEAAKKGKKGKREKRGKQEKQIDPAMERVIMEEEPSLLIPILIALLAIVGVFTLAMAGLVGWSFFRAHQPRAQAPQPSAQTQPRQVSPRASAQSAVFLLDDEL